MYKIKYLVTGHEFLLPDETAQELKDKYPNDYKILEKNGKKFKDKKTIIKFKDGSIRELVLDENIKWFFKWPCNNGIWRQV